MTLSKAGPTKLICFLKSSSSFQFTRSRWYKNLPCWLITFIRLRILTEKVLWSYCSMHWFLAIISNPGLLLSDASTTSSQSMTSDLNTEPEGKSPSPPSTGSAESTGDVPHSNSNPGSSSQTNQGDKQRDGETKSTRRSLRPSTVSAASVDAEAKYVSHHSVLRYLWRKGILMTLDIDWRVDIVYFPWRPPIQCALDLTFSFSTRSAVPMLGYSRVYAHTCNRNFKRGRATNGRLTQKMFLGS
jgi:hypothetical protein